MLFRSLCRRLGTTAVERAQAFSEDAFRRRWREIAERAGLSHTRGGSA